MEFGIYSAAAGGVIEAQFATRESAESRAFGYWVAEGEDVNDLPVIEVCPHGEFGEQCEECNS